MIDLNMKPKPEPKEAETPVGVVILFSIPFAIFFWILLTASFIGGIF